MRCNEAKHRFPILLAVLSLIPLCINLASGCASSRTGEHSKYRPNEIGIEKHTTKYEAIDKGKLWRTPKLVHYEKPDYPRIARVAGIEGTAVLELVIGTDGRVEDAKIVDSRVSSIMEESLLDASKKFVYRPGERRFRPIRCKAIYRIRFALNDDVVPVNID